MEDKELIFCLREELIKFEAEKATITDLDKGCINNIRLALSLFEQRIAISNEDEYYFRGQYFVSRFLCDQGYVRIDELYSELVEEVKKRNYYRVK